jgi:hypothetical protein
MERLQQRLADAESARAELEGRLADSDRHKATLREALEVCG